MSGRFPACIALAAMLFAASSPLLAALRFPAATVMLAQICTLGGVAPAPNGPGLPSHRETGPLKHCVFCLGGAWQPPAGENRFVIAPPAGPALRLAPEPVAPALERPALQPLAPRAPPRA